MATPMTATQIVAQLKKWGIKYKEVKSWSSHNRNAKGAWGGMNGFIWHHTGADVSAANSASYASSTLYNGLSSLPGPLCHFGLAPDGMLYLVGWGRANHAGGGDPKVLQHVIDEDYSGQLKPTKGNSNGTDGNAHFYGVEIMYSGSRKMTDAQYQTALKLSAAILDFHKWTEKSVIGHGEWSNDKWDPGYASGKIMNMADVRAAVKATLKAGPKGTVPAPSKPAPTTPKPTGDTYTVKKGDTLWSISQALKVTVADLKSWNGLKSDDISIGQVLKTKKPATTTPKPPTVPTIPVPVPVIVPKSRETKDVIVAQAATALKAWPFISDIEKAKGLPTGLLLAVGSRETNLTNVIGDGGNGFGVWQRDKRYWPVDDSYLNDVKKQAEDAATLLAANYKVLKSWDYAVAAYNAGVDGVQKALAALKSADAATTGGDYAADVLGRLAFTKDVVPTTTPTPTLEQRVTDLEKRVAALEKK
ncbi:LysM-like peptidoglycan binding protein [Streptomyces phage Evy]|uniref:LysM-like peptidoglycan binding protein n=1 Tax=Streptomyces phage Evy TaxID=2588514 RepID=A0A514DK00_9CAUD|nr:endolysin [Streptomyces phage Evy]QDH93912.1 LysM-like peptidoglycan binding protein [Streptomyces phage Evy]UEM46833.1 endolysin [Streptomyces phage Targaryen]